MAKKNKNNSLRKLIFNDKYLIITALILAVIVWVVTSLNIGTDETRTININVPIKISDDLSQQLGMEYYTLQNTVDIDVTVSGAKYVIGQVSDKDLNVKFDTSNVNRAGEHSIPILVTNKSTRKEFTVSSVYPSSIEAYFDVEESKNYDISLLYDDKNVAGGYVFGTPVISEDSVTVTGPKSYVDNIKRIVSEVDFGSKTKLKESYTQECELKPEGNSVEKNYLTFTSVSDEGKKLNSISVTIPVLKQAKLPVAVNFEGAPSLPVQNAISVSYSIPKVNVGILESTDISKAIIGTINYSDLSVGVNEFTFDTNDVQGVYFIDNSDSEITVTVTVSDEYEEITVPIKTSDVTVGGVPDGKKASVFGLKDSRVSVIVPKGTLLTSSDLKIKADVSEENEDGEYTLNIKPNDKSSWVYSDYTANIEVE